MSTGENLDRVLEEHGMTKTRLAEESGISYRTICRIASGDMTGTLDTWVRIASAIGCGVDELVD